MQLLNSIKKNGVTFLALLFICSFSGFAQNAPELSDPEIAHVAVTANQIDVDYGKLALEKTQNAEARKFAQTMIDDHENIINQASALVQKLGVTPEDNAVSKSLVNQQKETLKKLKGLDGQAFTKAYIDNEVAYHDAVIGAVKSLLIPQSQNEELKETLNKVMPLLEHHLKMAQIAQKNLK